MDQLGGPDGQLLQQLVEKLRKAHGDDLVSVILYGSAASPGQHHAGFSDINVLCVLRAVTPVQLAQAQPVFTWWRTHEKPVPLLLSEQEVARSADCFAIEFHDMLLQRRVLAGRDVIEGLLVENTFYRTQVEYELRSKLLRLRQKAAAILADRKLLARLLLESVTTFCVLTRHALLLHGIDAPHDRRRIVELARQQFSIDPGSFNQLLDIREKKSKPVPPDPAALLSSYLEQIGIIIDAVDRLAIGNLELPVVKGDA